EFNIYAKTARDCRPQVPGLEAGAGNYYYNSPGHKPDVEVSGLSDFKAAASADLSYADGYTLAFDHCNQTTCRRQVYCKQQNNSKDEGVHAIDIIAENVATMVTYTVNQSTYYQQ